MNDSDSTTINQIYSICQKLMTEDEVYYQFSNGNVIGFDHLFDGSKFIKFLTKKQIGHYVYHIKINNKNDEFYYEFYNNIDRINLFFPKREISNLDDFKLLLEEILISQT